MWYSFREFHFLSKRKSKHDSSVLFQSTLFCFAHTVISSLYFNSCLTCLESQVHSLSYSQIHFSFSSQLKFYSHKKLEKAMFYVSLFYLFICFQFLVINIHLDRLLKFLKLKLPFLIFVQPHYLLLSLLSMEFCYVPRCTDIKTCLKLVDNCGKSL